MRANTQSDRDMTSLTLKAAGYGVMMYYDMAFKTARKRQPLAASASVMVHGGHLLPETNA